MDDGRRTSPDPLATAAAERRVRVRHLQDLRTFCQRGAGELDQLWCQGQVRDISANGMGLLVPHGFTVDTILTVEVENSRRSQSRRVQVRVVRGSRQAGGLWLLGCVFAEELTDDELVSLLE
jgi:hypothetical protein